MKAILLTKTVLQSPSRRQTLRHRQAGIGVAAWLLILLMAGALMSIASQLLPVFMDHNTMSGILDGMAEETGLTAKRDVDIQNMIIKRFKMNNIRDFRVDQHIVINRSREGVEIVMDYEVRMPLVKNVDMIASFDKKVELRN